MSLQILSPHKYSYTLKKTYKVLIWMSFTLFTLIISSHFIFI